MTYAIIETGGKQIKVEPGRFYDIELLSAQPDEKVTIDKVLLVQHNGDVTIGQPLVTGAKVEGTVLRHLRGRKVLVYKMQPKKKTRKKRGHRQEITRLMIDSISLNGSVLATGETTEAPAPAQVSEVDSEVGTVPPPEALETNAEEAAVDTIEASATTEA
ncbi:50S ribosomal protein L21 [Scytonema hofmannii PCC 7110]|uniref:Large ribosomal subunit protein bL21 n=1 Tax=Scytonema hofmannii PCC 7110 TaxID=128403 RepID=A0A139XDH6_9CYAN|nr:50S ribosomal protein L21 [Scytonema hofmannii]KYC42749.1 50S ribosomal protein L21 [Scytonema hofmannii PCC 7110]